MQVGGAAAMAVGRLLGRRGSGMRGYGASTGSLGGRAHAASSCLGSRQRRQHACKVVPQVELMFNVPLLLCPLCAASGGHIRVVSSLLAANADCDVQNSNGNTPLHLAACKGGRRTKSAWRRGAGAECQDLTPASARLPLKTCTSHRMLKVVLHVQGAAGCSCHITHLTASRPHHRPLSATRAGWLEVVEALLAAGADVHIRNGKGWTAAQSAASSGFFDAVLALVRYGAAWRQKGDADVCRLLCKKSSYKWVEVG